MPSMIPHSVVYFHNPFVLMCLIAFFMWWYDEAWLELKETGQGCSTHHRTRIYHPHRSSLFSEEGNQSRFYIGQQVIDRDGNEVGTVEARFSHSILVTIGTLVRPAYIPLHLIEDVNPHFIWLSINEFDRHRLGLQNVPDDLYEVEPEYDVPVVNGMPMFASKIDSISKTCFTFLATNSPL